MIKGLFTKNKVFQKRLFCDMVPKKRSFPRIEFENRYKNAQILMEKHKIDAMLLTTEANFHYFTGLISNFWCSPTRPMYLLLNKNDVKPVAIVPEISLKSMEKTWVNSIYTWDSPNFLDDGISILNNQIDKVKKEYNTIGITMGLESQLRMPFGDTIKVMNFCKENGLKIKDSSPIIRELRMIKSENELDKLRLIGNMASQAFENLPDRISNLSNTTLTERTIVKEMQIELLKNGVDDIPYIIGKKGRIGYESVIDGPSDTKINKGDLYVIDTGAQYDNYYCDFNRNFIIGEADDISNELKVAHKNLWHATEEALKEIKPGKPLNTLWYAMVNSLISSGVDSSFFNKGRIGHGLGLQLTEWPSIVKNETLILKPGMVLTLEPSVPLCGGIMTHEENIIVTENGYEMLSKRESNELPIINMPKENRYSKSKKTTISKLSLNNNKIPEIILDFKPKAMLGFIQLPSDLTLDNEIGPILSQINGVNWRLQKMKFINNNENINGNTYKQSIINIEKAANTLIPQSRKDYGSIDVLAMACTSLSFSLGSESVKNELLKGYPMVGSVTDTATAIIEALNSFNQKQKNKNIALFTPYIDEIHNKNISFLEDNGYIINAHYNLNLSTDSEATSVNPKSIEEHVKALVTNRKVDILVIGCSALRSTGYGFIDNLEKELKIPVITSNQALIWTCINKCPTVYKDEIKSIKGYGTLFKNHYSYDGYLFP